MKLSCVLRALRSQERATQRLADAAVALVHAGCGASRDQLRETAHHFGQLAAERARKLLRVQRTAVQRKHIRDLSRACADAADPRQRSFGMITLVEVGLELMRQHEGTDR